MIRVADIDGNGRLDVVISHSEKEGYPVSWYSASDPKGRWTEHVIDPSYGWCQTLDVGDVDLDGDLDILAARFTRPSPPDVPPPHDIRIYYNRRDGSGVWAEQVVRSDGGLYFGHLADMDADGDLDVVGPRSYWTGPIELWRNRRSDRKLSLDKWMYIEVDANRGKWGDWDEPDWLRYFGLAMADVTGDGSKDIVAGRYFYRNPGGNMTAKWPRATFGLNVDGMLFVDVDGDALGDVIGQALPDVYWLEAKDRQGSSWKATRIGTLPRTGHVNGQGYMLAQLVPGGRPEVILACGDGTYYFEIPEDPETGNWPKTRIAAQALDEGIGVGDVDSDGDIDVSTGKKEGDIYSVRWYENAGDRKPDW